MSKFAHLHVHSEYSALDGISKIKEIPEHAKSLGQEAVALTDHGNVAGSYEFWTACRKHGVKPIIGLEAYYTVNDRTAREKDEDGNAYYHLILMAKNNRGLHNLYKLSTKAYTEGFYYHPRCDDELLNEYSEGLIATSACLGSRSSQLIMDGRKKEAEALLDHHAAIFGDNWFIELQLHEGVQQEVNQVLVEIAKKRGWPMIVTGDTHYTSLEHKDIHDTILCVATNARKWQTDRFSFDNRDHHIASHDWMWKHAKAQGLPYEVMSNTQHVADLVEDNYFEDYWNRYPKYPKVPDGYTVNEWLERTAKLALEDRFGGMPPAEYRDRMNHELKVIKRMGFSDYILIIMDIVKLAGEVGTPMGPGRGSAAGSLVAYALGITQVDPIKYSLLFSRFLNEGRAQRPLIFDTKLRDQIQDLPKSNHTQHCNHQ